jgi:hypothetical protein
MDDTVHPVVEPYLTLLDVAKAIASHRHVSDLFQDLTTPLHRVLEFHYLSVVLYDAAQHVMRLQTLATSVRAGFKLVRHSAWKTSRRAGSGRISSRWSSAISHRSPAFPASSKRCVSTPCAPSAACP